MKKTLMLIAMICLLFNAVVFAEESETYTSGDFEYILLEDGTAEISAYIGFDEELVIPEFLDGYSVTSIGDNAFKNRDLSSITLPDSITTIGERAFMSCESLHNIYLPDNLTTIGEGAFVYCSSLTSINLPDSINNVTVNPFAGCGDIEFNISPDHPYLAVIDGVLFSKPDKRLIFCPNTKEIYEIPDGIQCIGYGAFIDCYNLKCISLPDSVTTIGEGAFSYCPSLTSINLPDSINNVTVNPFAGCGDIEFNISPDHPYLAVIDGVLFSKPDKRLIFCPNTKEIYEIPDGIQCIGYGAFGECYNLSSITLPDSLTTIGDRAFCSCSSLSSTTLPDSLTTIGDAAFDYCENLTITVSRDSYAAEYCRENGLNYTYPDVNDWLNN